MPTPTPTAPAPGKQEQTEALTLAAQLATIALKQARADPGPDTRLHNIANVIQFESAAIADLTRPKPENLKQALRELAHQIKHGLFGPAHADAIARAARQLPPPTDAAAGGDPTIARQAPAPPDRGDPAGPRPPPQEFYGEYHQELSAQTLHQAVIDHLERLRQSDDNRNTPLLPWLQEKVKRGQIRPRATFHHFRQLEADSDEELLLLQLLEELEENFGDPAAPSTQSQEIQEKRTQAARRFINTVLEDYDPQLFESVEEIDLDLLDHLAGLQR